MKRKSALRFDGDEGMHGKFADSRRLWALLDALEVAMFIEDETTDTGDEPEGRPYKDVPRVDLQLRRPASRAPYSIKLSQFTLEELEAFERVVTTAINEARPTCAEQDRRAQEEFDNDGNPRPRLYRRVPVVHERQRRQRRDDPGVPG